MVLLEIQAGIRPARNLRYTKRPKALSAVCMFGHRAEVHVAGSAGFAV
jgi:hypothetical protein